MDNPNMMQGAPRGDAGKVCKCPHHKIMPLLVVLFGLDFLFGALGWLSMDFVNMSWPVLVVAAGLMKMSKGMCGCCPNP